MKMLKFLLSAVMLVALLAGIQITSYAALASPADDEVSPVAQEEVSPVAQENETSLPETSRMPTQADIYPISANPDTGVENLAIPAIVALLAASTAAITLSSKKK